MKLEASIITRRFDIVVKKNILVIICSVRSANEMQEDLKYPFERALHGLI